MDHANFKKLDSPTLKKTKEKKKIKVLTFFFYFFHNPKR